MNNLKHKSASHISPEDDDFVVRLVKARVGDVPLDKCRMITRIRQHENLYATGKNFKDRSKCDKQLCEEIHALELQRHGQLLTRAIIALDSQWFREIATVLDGEKERADEPADPARYWFLSFVSQRLVSPNKTYRGTLQSTKTYAEVEKYFQDKHKRYDLDARQIRRWCKELGICLCKVKRGRRKGSHNCWA